MLGVLDSRKYLASHVCLFNRDAVTISFIHMFVIKLWCIASNSLFVTGCKPPIYRLGSNIFIPAPEPYYFSVHIAPHKNLKAMSLCYFQRERPFQNIFPEPQMDRRITAMKV